MHWIQTIREHLKLSQADLAHYLNVSVHTVISAENDRRQLPMESLQPALDLFNTVMAGLKQAPGQEPLLKTDRAIPAMKRLHYRCCCKLDRLNGQLRQMEKNYADAHLSLGVYRTMLLSLASANTKGDLVRLRWMQIKIEETVHQLRANDVDKQWLLATQITSVKSVMVSLEDHFHFNPETG